MKLGLALMLLAWSAAAPALAVSPSEQLANPALESRARNIGGELRCVVCQNQTIDDSDAPLAADLRVLLRQRLVAGDTDPQAIAFIVDRYGRFVLLKPPIESDTLLLWWGPLALVSAGALATYLHAHSRGRGVDDLPLTEEDLA